MEVMMIASSLPRCLDPSGSLLSSSAQIGEYSLSLESTYNCFWLVQNLLRKIIDVILYDDSVNHVELMCSLLCMRESLSKPKLNYQVSCY